MRIKRKQIEDTAPGRREEKVKVEEEKRGEKKNRQLFLQKVSRSLLYLLLLLHGLHVRFHSTTQFTLLLLHLCPTHMTFAPKFSLKRMKESGKKSKFKGIQLLTIEETKVWTKNETSTEEADRVLDDVADIKSFQQQ